MSYDPPVSTFGNCNCRFHMAAAVPKNEDADARKVMDIMFTKGVSEAEKFLDTVM